VVSRGQFGIDQYRDCPEPGGGEEGRHPGEGIGQREQDPVAGAKVLSEFAKDNELFVIKGGAMANALMSIMDVKALATMPSREELLAKLAGTLRAPIAKLARTLNEVPGKFARALAAVHAAREKSAA